MFSNSWPLRPTSIFCMKILTVYLWTRQKKIVANICFMPQNNERIFCYLSSSPAVGAISAITRFTLGLMWRGKVILHFEMWHWLNIVPHIPSTQNISCNIEKIFRNNRGNVTSQIEMSQSNWRCKQIVPHIWTKYFSDFWVFS